MIAQLPNPTPKLSDRHIDKLKESALSLEQIDQLGHRTVTAAEAKQLVGHPLPGMLLPYLSLNGRPYQILTGKWARKPFVRLRPDWDQVSEKLKADYADADGQLPKYLSPSGCGNRPYFSPLMDWERVNRKPSRFVILTEGEFKGDSGCAHGFPTIAGAGVAAFVDRTDRGDWGAGMGSAWDTAEEPEDDRLPSSRFLPELDEFNWVHRPVAIIFDSDILAKFSVRKAAESLLTHVRARAGSGFIVVLPNEMGGEKNGLDDFLQRHGPEALQLLLDAFRAQQHGKTAMAQYGPATKMKGGTKVLGGRRLDGQPHDGSEVCVLRLTEPDPHTKALMAWSVLKERWAYRPALGWYRWDGRKWAETNDATALGVDLSRFFDAQNWQSRTGAHYSYCQEEMARRCFIPDDQWDSPRYLNFTNGILDLQTNEFGPHKHTRYCTTILPYDYDPSAKCPQWLNFLAQATGGDDQLQVLLQAWCKWAIVPKDRTRKSPVEKSLDLVGRKGSGKGTFLDVLMQLVGEENCGSASPETFATPEGLGQLIDKRLAIDTDASGYMAGIGNFNKTVSNEPVGIKKLFKDKSMQRLGVVVVRSYNDFISVPSSGTEGLDRRLCVVPFRFPPTCPDYGLDAKLRSELPGIFAWAWSLPLARAQTIIRWSGSIDAVKAASIDRFLNDHPEVKYLMDDYPVGKEGVQAYDLYEGYVDWAKRNGHRACSNTKFGTLLNELGIEHIKTNGGLIFYNVPDMRSSFNLAKYLRISPGMEGEMPPELTHQKASNPLPEPVRESWEGAISTLPMSNPLPEPVREGWESGEGSPLSSMQDLKKNTTEQKDNSMTTWKPTGKPIAVGSMVEVAGSAKMHRRGSFTINQQMLLSQHRGEEAQIPIDCLPEWLQVLLSKGPHEVVEISDDGQRAKILLGRKPVVLGTAGLYEVVRGI